MEVYMPKVQKKNSRTRKVELGVYFDYDLGGGFPYGHTRTLHVELYFINGTRVIVRNGGGGEDLKNLVERRGKPVGSKKTLPDCKDFSSRSYTREFLLPSSLSRHKIDKQIDFTPVLF